MNFRSNDKRAIETRMDITSLVDVIFLLIIFLILTMTFKKKDHSFRIVLPTATQEEQVIETDKTTVFITTAGDYYLLEVPADGSAPKSDAAQVTIDELKASLVALAKEKPDTPISIKAEKESAYQYLIDVVNICYETGLMNLYFPYELKEGDAAPAPTPPAP